MMNTHSRYETLAQSCSGMRKDDSDLKMRTRTSEDTNHYLCTTLRCVLTEQQQSAEEEKCCGRYENQNSSQQKQTNE